MALWLEARNKFLEDLKSKKVSEDEVQQFLQSQANPQDARNMCKSLSASTARKNSSIEIGGKKVSFAKILSAIIRNIDRFIAIGNVVIQVCAPETVALGWWAVKTVLSAIQDEPKLFAKFGYSLDSITSMMVTIGSYAEIYDRRDQMDWAPSEAVTSLLNNIREAYRAILDFSFTVSRYSKAGKLAKIGHVFSHILGSSSGEFDEKLATIQSIKTNILENSANAFQETTFGGLRKVQDSIAEMRRNVVDHEEILQEIREAVKADRKKTTIEELALQDFERNKKLLDPLQGSEESLQSLVLKRQQDTCQWLFDHSAFCSWRASKHCSLMCLQGSAGTGKSVLLGAIVEHLKSELKDEENYCFQYICCESTNDDVPTSSQRVQNTIIYQLFEKVGDFKEDGILIQKCNTSLKNPKSHKQKGAKSGDESLGSKSGGNALDKAKKSSLILDLGDTLSTLCELLKQKLVIVIDAVESLTDDEQRNLVSSLVQTCQAKDMQALIVFAGDSDKAAGKEIDQMNLENAYKINVEQNNREDVATVLKKQLRDIPGFSDDERKEAEVEVLKKTGGRFKYLIDIALPHLQQPFIRPISGHLQQLPNGLSEKYVEAISKLTINYKKLLETTLKWTLLAKVSPRVTEIMDAHSETFVQNTTDIENSGILTDGSTPQLYITQLKQAAGIFVGIERADGGDIVYLRDFKPVQDFCLTARNQTLSRASTFHEDQICAKCSQEISERKILEIDEVLGHVSIALTCLRHLRNLLFQKLYMSLEGEENDKGGAEEMGDAEKGEDVEADNNPSDLRLEASEITKDAESEAIPVTEAATNGTADFESKEHEKVAMPETDTERVQCGGTEGIAGEEKKEKDDHDDDGGDNQSQDSEDIEDYGALSDEPEDPEDDYVSRLRYEIVYWPFHVSRAECNLPDDEKASSEEWRMLQEELYAFVVKDKAAFQAWRKRNPWSGRHQRTPLQFAAFFGLTTLARRLIAEGAEVQPDNSDFPPLTLAVIMGVGNYELVRLLLENGADPNHPDDQGCTALHNAFFYGTSLEIVKLLLERGARTDMLTSVKANPFHYCANKSSDPATISLLVDSSGEKASELIKAGDQFGETPLHWLMCRRPVPDSMLEALIAHGADVDKDDNDSERPLYETAFYSDIEAMKKIIHLVTDVDDDNTQGRTALHAAAWKANREAVELLLEYKADVLRKDLHGRTAFFYACWTYLSNGMADRREHVQTAKLLLDKMVESGATIDQINAPTKNGRTPLRMAAAHGFLEIVQKLLELLTEPAAINKQDNLKGRNALMCAAKNGQAEIVKLLLQKGGDGRLRSGKDKDEKSALELCHEQWKHNGGGENYEATLLLLIENDPATAVQNHDILTTAATLGCIPVLEKLLDAKADLNKPDQFGWTPMLLAQQYQQEETIKFLTDHVASVVSGPSRLVPPPALPEGATISEDTLGVEWPGAEETYVFIANHPIPAGRSEYSFEVTLSHPSFEPNSPANPEVGVGLCNSSSASQISFPGWRVRLSPSTHSWAYHADNGGYYTHTKSPNPIGYQAKYGPGHTVGCHVDFKASSMFFTLDGKKHEEPVHKNVKGRLFPIIGVHREAVKFEVKFST